MRQLGIADNTLFWYTSDNDPHEQNDISNQTPEQLESIKERLTAWQKSVLRSLNGEDYSTQ